MYVLGHTTFAYLILRSFTKYYEIKLEPRIILLIFVFANIIDSIHFGIFRFAGHNLIGTFIVTSTGLILLYNFKMIEFKHFPILFSASLTHVITDYWFSKYHWLFPLTDAGYVVFGFNSFEDMLAESFFGILFIIAFVLTGDFVLLKKFYAKEIKKVKNEFNFKNLFNQRFYYFYIMTIFYLFILGQFYFFNVLNLEELSVLIWYRWMFLLIYVLFIIIMTRIWIPIKRR